MVVCPGHDRAEMNQPHHEISANAAEGHRVDQRTWNILGSKIVCSHECALDVSSNSTMKRTRGRN